MVILSDLEIQEAVDAADFASMVTADDYIYVIARAVESALIKNKLKHVCNLHIETDTGRYIVDRGEHEDIIPAYVFLEVNTFNRIAGRQ